MQTRRLSVSDRELARTLFALMAEVFEEPCAPLGDDHLDHLLGRADFWAIAAFRGDAVVGGLTAHVLPMTRSESSEVFLYDIAVRADHQRRGVGRQLMAALREGVAAAGIPQIFVAADNEDTEALDFYRALGGVGSPVTVFTFSPGASVDSR